MVNFPSDVLEELRLHLEEEKKRLTKEQETLTAQDPFSDPDRSFNVSASDMEASDEASHDRFAAMVDEVKGKLVDIDSALMRIADGRYGTCTVCGNMIDTDRLAILPTATLCLTCEREKAQKK